MTLLVASLPNARDDGGGEGNGRRVVSEFNPSLENKCGYSFNGYGVGARIGLSGSRGRIGDDIIVSKRLDCRG